MHYLSKSPEQTHRFGEQLSRHLKPGDVICLFGPLGSGKTVLTKGIATGLGLTDKAVTSPTFTFLNILEGKTHLYHFDLYRIDELKEIEDLGIDDFLYNKGVCVIEWAEKMKTLLPDDHLEIKISHKDETTRAFDVAARGTRSKKLLQAIFK